MNRHLTALAAALCLATPALAETSQWGADDQIGAANRITPESVAAAMSLVTTGKTYALGMVIDDTIPAYPPRQIALTVLQPRQAGKFGDGPTKSTYNDDIFVGWLGVGSQIDGLGHVGTEHVYYNDNKGEDFAQPSGLTKLGVEQIPPIVARGVMLDMTGDADLLPEGTAITPEMVDAAAQAQGVEIREGDVVLFHTGWLSLLTGDAPDPGRYGSGEPGITPDTARMLAEKGVVAVGADTWGVEAVPFAPGAGVFEAHQVLLQHNGIYILENMVTEELVADGVHEFVFVLGAARVKGAVQMIINPVAIR